MSDCSKDQTEHAVVVTEAEDTKDCWEFFPSKLCVNKGDTIWFFMKSQNESSEKVEIVPDVSGFFSSTDLGTTRNSILKTKVIDSNKVDTVISVKPGPKVKSDKFLAPTLPVKVRR